ncbi:MAG: hypothetical protein ABL961_08095 [Vicinamibacterales bacterium]
MNARTMWRVVIGLLVAATPLCAQDAVSQDAEKAGASTGVHASVDVGYRVVDVSGSSDAFRQYFDVDDGFRLLGVDMHGQMKPGRVADTFFVTASGLGGDPFPTLQVSLSKARRYNLKINWRRSRFFDRSPATPASLNGFDTRAVTDRHSWTTARQIGNAAWTYMVSNRFHLLFDYDRVANSGDLQTTRSLDYVGASAVWASFARANAFEVAGPTSNTSDRATAGLSYSRDRWTLAYRAGYQVFKDDQRLAPLSASERSINVVDAATNSERLTDLNWTQTRRISAPLSELSLVVRPIPALEWRSDFMLYRYHGPFALDATYAGTARTTTAGTAFSPYNVVVNAQGEVKTPNYVVDQGVTWRPLNRWAFDARYRYSHTAITSEGAFGSVVSLYPTATNGPTGVSEEVTTDWRNVLHSLELTATWSPVPALTIRPGVRLSQRNVVFSEDGVVEPGATNRERTVWPEFSVGYRPNGRFSTRGSYQTTYSDSPYTRMSPIERSVGRVVLHVEPLAGFSVEASASRVDAEQNDAAFLSHSRSGALTLAYAVSERVSITGGFDYQSLLATGNGTFIRGTLPITNLPMSDREIDRVWQAGVVLQPVKHFGITATGNFDRTTGLDTIFGEPALYGPQSLFYGTGSVWVDVARAGRISVDLQRTTLTQEILALNNFRANLLTLRFSHTF